VERLDEIRLHAERYTLPPATADALNRALAERRRIVAVGTTTTRTLEHIAQQAATADPAAGDSATWVPQVAPHSGSTSIFLAPGHRFRIVSGLLTNFHLPGSTLLMLVSAFAAPAASPDAGRKTSPDAGRQASPDVGRKTVLAAYAHAVRHGYRFYSYGDCMLLL
jgi:S-adenosylmethionine:tRNA ribosyltransferase-isomerase